MRMSHSSEVMAGLLITGERRKRRSCPTVRTEVNNAVVIVTLTGKYVCLGPTTTFPTMEKGRGMDRK